MIISCGADAVYRPLNFAHFQRIAAINPEFIQMEVCRSYYKESQLIALNQYVITEFRESLSAYNMSQRTTIVENISRHISYIHLNNHGQ